MEGTLISLRAKFCNGDLSTIWEMINLIFPELMVSSPPSHLQFKAKHLGELGLDIFSKPELLCISELETVEFFEKELQLRINRELRPAKEKELKKEVASEDERIIAITEEKDQAKPKALLAALFFQKSLPAAEQVLYEMTYVQKWKGIPNIRRLQLFLVNTLSWGNYRMRDDLRKNPAIETVEISNWFMSNLKRYFLGKKNEVEAWDDFSNSLKNMVNKNVEDDFKNIGQNLRRRELRFQKDLNLFEFKDWNDVEVIFYMLYKYMKIENHLEIWHQMNIESQFHLPLENEMKKFKLWNKNALLKNEGISESTIIKRLKLMKDDLGFIKGTMKKIQLEIDKKSTKAIDWRTY